MTLDPCATGSDEALGRGHVVNWRRSDFAGQSTWVLDVEGFSIQARRFGTLNEWSWSVTDLATGRAQHGSVHGGADHAELRHAAMTAAEKAWAERSAHA